jgi:hypothetical protein
MKRGAYSNIPTHRSNAHADPNRARMIENIARHESIHSLLFELGEASDGASMTMRSRSALESRVGE